MANGEDANNITDRVHNNIKSRPLMFNGAISLLMLCLATRPVEA